MALTASADVSPRDYARAGRLGIGTPQANPTVEAEIRRLLPLDIDYVTLRLTSPSSDPITRLKAYLTDLPHHAKQFAGMNIDIRAGTPTGKSALPAPKAVPEDGHLSIPVEDIYEGQNLFVVLLGADNQPVAQRTTKLGQP